VTALRRVPVSTGTAVQTVGLATTAAAISEYLILLMGVLLYGYSTEDGASSTSVRFKLKQLLLTGPPSIEHSFDTLDCLAVMKE
jgi:hypothetical protein